MAVQFFPGFRAFKSESSASRAPAAPKARVESLAQGDAITAAADQIGLRSRAHGDAVVTATLSALSALAKKPGVSALPYAKVHLLHAVFANADSATAVIHGAQLGASGAVRDRTGQVHVYALAYIR